MKFRRSSQEEQVILDEDGWTIPDALAGENCISGWRHITSTEYVLITVLIWSVECITSPQLETTMDHVSHWGLSLVIVSTFNIVCMKFIQIEQLNHGLGKSETLTP